MMKHLNFLFIIFVFISCDTLDIDVHKLESFIGVKLQDYTVVRHESSFGIGTSTMVLELEFTEKSMTQLLKDIDLRKYSVMDNNIYYFNVFSEETVERETVMINLAKRTITYSYRD